MQTLFSVDQVIEKISRGETLILAGDEKVMSQLPQGNWIGGSTPYFMGDQGGEFSQDNIYVTQIPSNISFSRVALYDDRNVENIYKDLPEKSFGVVIMPAFSAVHVTFSNNAPNFEHFAMNPLIGWISGFNLKEIGKLKPKVFDGRNGQSDENTAIVMQLTLPEDKTIELGIINLFKEGDGDVIEFTETGFSASKAIVNGQTVDFVQYCKEKAIDPKVPLVSNYFGAHINTSFQSLDGDAVRFYAPVFKGQKYCQAVNIEDYASTFESSIDLDGETLFFSCNCILNYLYGELEGKTVKSIKGPVTFGEIAYQLLNQTLAYARIVDA